MKKFQIIQQMMLMLIVVWLAGLMNQGLAKEIPPGAAKHVAETFIQNHFTTDSLTPEIPVGLSLIYTQTHTTTQVINHPAQTPLYYVFSFDNDEGFVIISADDRVQPVLAYSVESGFDNQVMHPEIRKWLGNYTRQIRETILADQPQDNQLADIWESLLSGNRHKSIEVTNSAGPLLETKWGQSPFVNAHCPFDYDAQSRAVTGCTQTAMAQVMKYWNHPNQGSGFHSFNHDKYGTLSANFGSTQYNWSAMPNEVTAYNEAVAELMYHCGVANEANYGANLTGAYVIYYPDYQNACTETSLKNYFGYDPELSGKWRGNYTDSQWIGMLKSEIDNARPILYAGFGNGGGHAFVCDGYNGNYFHMNWGWQGSYDGYFIISALNPGGVGTGGGTGGYNNHQHALFGVKPHQTQSENLEMALYDNLTVDPSPISYGAAFTVHTDVANFSDTDFTGDFGVALFDSDVNFVDFVEILSNYSLGSGYHYTDGLDFENAGSLSYLPGSYYLAAFYRPAGGDWKIISDNGDYSNIAVLEITHENDLELWDQLTISTGESVVQNQAFSVHLDVANTGNSDFYGTLDVSIYDLEGNFVEIIDEKNNITLEAGYHFTNGLDFSTQGLQSEPGTYLLALLYKPSSGDWQLAGSSNHTNPIKIILKSAPLEGDQYENNNSRDQAFLFDPSFGNQGVHITTPGSTIHTGSDYDFYGLELDGGFTYTLTGRLHDAYSSTDGNSYTNDALVSLLLDEYTSDTYDDVLPTFEIRMFTDGIVYLFVAPYFPGQKGSYLLDLNLTRVVGTGKEEHEIEQTLTTYPNPAGEYLWLKWSDPSERIIRFEIVDQHGRLVKYIQRQDYSLSGEQLDISDLPPGLYGIRSYGKKVHFSRFIKAH